MFLHTLVALSTPAHAAPAEQVDICHWSDHTASVITINANALGAHVANHGDSIAALYFADADGDGYGDPGGATDRCPNDGFVGNNSDCDDTDSAVNPGAEEVCDNAVDDNCDGGIDEGCASDCPCYTVADLDAVYADYLDGIGGYDHESGYFNCTNYTGRYTGLAQSVLDVYIRAHDDDGAYEYKNWSLRARASDVNSSYCYASEQVSAWDGVSLSGYSSQIFPEVTREVGLACRDLLLEWADDNAITCFMFDF